MTYARSAGVSLTLERRMKLRIWEMTASCSFFDSWLDPESPLLHPQNSPRNINIIKILNIFQSPSSGFQV